MKKFLVVGLAVLLLAGLVAGVGMWRGWFGDTEPKEEEIVGYVNGGGA